MIFENCLGMVKCNTAFSKYPHLYSMKIFFSYLLVFLFSSSYAQGYNPENVKSVAKFSYEKAVEFLQYDELNQALPFLNKALELDNKYEDALLSLGGVYNELKNYQLSTDNYEKAFAIDAAYAKYYYNTYSISLAGLGKFNDALNAINKFLAIPKLNEKSIKSATYRKNSYQFAIDYAAVHPMGNYVFSPKNLGDKINTDKSEYYPSFTIDDSILVYTRRAGGIEEDFIKSSLVKDGYAQSAIMQGSINQEPSKGAINISQDGEWLVFAGNFAQKGMGDFKEVMDDISVTDAAQIKKVLFCSGKIYFDLAERKDRDKRNDVAIIRLEQLYPLPAKQIADLYKKYNRAVWFWVQEEPLNMGAASFLKMNLQNINYGIISRNASASTATGYNKVHKQEQEQIISLISQMTLRKYQKY